MKAVILAAGPGSRLQPLTERVHKCLIKVADERILERQVRYFDQAGIEDIYVVIGYRSDEVEGAIQSLNKDTSNTTVHAIRNPIWDQTENLYSLYLASEFVRGEPFVIANGDVFADQGIIERICESAHESIVPYDSQEFDPEELKIELNNGRPSAILDKGKRNGDGSTIGMFALSSDASNELFSDIDDHVNKDSEKKQWFEASLDRIFDNVDFKAFDVKEFRWFEIDTKNDLKKASLSFGSTESEVEQYIESIMSDSNLRTENQTSD